MKSPCLPLRLPQRILIQVTYEARKTFAFIRACIANDRYALALHFQQRMEQRGLFWPDVLAAIDAPQGMHSPGLDAYGRPKWIIRGMAATGDGIEIVCAIEIDETEFITLYWED